MFIDDPKGSAEQQDGTVNQDGALAWKDAAWRALPGPAFPRSLDNNHLHRRAVVDRIDHSAI